MSGHGAQACHLVFLRCDGDRAIGCVVLHVLDETCTGTFILDQNVIDAIRHCLRNYSTLELRVSAYYDDGGLSGGTLERPALQRLLTDIDRHKVDLIVVYKVDRLTRSLADFAKIVEVFDAHGVSFVSVTQQFNTTTSMGRLTLNMLLSVAQFEREVTGERIRDKIAASKKKGMWMGGPPPLGYDVEDKKLVVNATEAKIVGKLFQLYLELGNVRSLMHEAEHQGIVTKRRQSGDRTTGGKPFTRGNLYQLLHNPLYAGKIPHKGKTYPGQHQAIIDPETWKAVQQLLSQNASTRQSSQNIKGIGAKPAGTYPCTA
ncbi:MAG: recombinase family protein [Alphaproteobacteria bacterium]|nr:recombinase family protein [Alphaproteobacteria bacterium]